MGLRILHLVSYPLFSGPVPPTVALVQGQRARGHAVWLAVDAREKRRNVFEEPARPFVEPLRAAPPVPLDLSARSGPIALVRDLRALAALAQQVDVVHVHTSHDHALCALAGVQSRARLVRTVHASRSLSWRPGQGWLLRRSDALILRCEEHRRRAQGMVGQAARCVTIPGSVDCQRFRPAQPAERAAARRRFGLPQEGAVLVQAALLARRGQEELCAAIARAEARVHLLLVGAGEAEGALRRLVQELGIARSVHFAGYLAQHELRIAYDAADAAFAAQAGNDASARAVLEAMACGLPVVGVAREAIGELVTPEVGYPVPERTPQAIAAGVAAWLRDLDAPRRGKRGRQVVAAQRPIEREVERTLEVYARSSRL